MRSYRQPNKNNQETGHTTQNNTTKKWPYLTAQQTHSKTRLRERTWFSGLVRYPARKRSGSILATLEPAHIVVSVMYMSSRNLSLIASCIDQFIVIFLLYCDGLIFSSSLNRSKALPCNNCSRTNKTG